MTRAILFISSVLLACLLFGACGDEDDTTDTSGDTTQSARVGEACVETSDCKEGLACLSGEQRCVVLCEPGSDACGEGIACIATAALVKP